ncbi:MAG TPA: hypothetical protein VNT50_13590 [Microbacterium sp.]|uniref:hypothetical protein n=1 Tax=Microbacterium sp. TaxID=51671 RepID=UPI002CCE2A8B|nr:hypothetical protein [Microbacterium sp.]HWI32512.1 hypothetical protein [Microbacterium sp.]
MSSTPDSPAHDGDDLAKLREEIDELKSHSTQDLIDPPLGDLAQDAPEPAPTDAIGSEPSSEDE